MNSSESIVVLGMFDGVHLGHARLFSIAQEIKKNTGYQILAYTFKNHPSELITGRQTDFILTNSEREEKLNRVGADKIIFDTFDRRICLMSAEDFGRILKERFNAAHVVAGFNYSFGYQGSGNVDLLKRLGEKYGYCVHVAEPVMYDNQVVSSTRIRQEIAKGNIRSANIMLNDSFCMSGLVEKCRQVGREIGFPTANIRNTQRKPLPLFGVYATRTKIDGEAYDSITNVGTNPTFGKADVSIETHIFDYSSNIYGKYIEVDFIDFIREQKCFTSVSELVKQIGSDCSEVKRIYGQRR